ncbi:MAG: glycoside hydrolase family 32 protein [Bacteroidota bacterium]
MKRKSLSFLRQIALIAAMTAFLGLQAVNGQGKIPDYTSKVPKYDFANTLSEQENQLRTNPLMIRFAESRQRQSADRYRPIYHFVSPESTLNDPNGICFWQGNWHLFYQGYPPEDRRQHWGHAVSKDLIHWKDLPYAIYPNPERAVFSGSSLVDGNRVIAMYHGTEVGNMVAVSDDPLLLNWKKTTTDRAAIPLRSEAGFPLPYSVFDPSIWKKDDIYYALSAGRAPKGPGGRQVATCYLFRSKDLINWQYVHEFVEDDRFTLIGDDYACPYFWPIGDRYILPFFSHMSGGQYLLGDYDTERDKFIVTQGAKFNFGPSTPSGVHAPSATPDGKGGVIIIFNMNPGKPTGEWNQIFTLPRRLTLVGKNEIGQEPAGDIESLRGEYQKVVPVKLPANKELIFKNIKGNAMEINLEIDPMDAPVISLNVLRSPGKEEYTQINFFRERGMPGGRDYRVGQIARVQGLDEPQPAPTVSPAAPLVRESLISIESSFSSLHPDVRPRGPETGSFVLDKDETLKLRIFIDKSVVEVFANGKQCVAVRVYPSRDDSIGFSIRSQGQESELKSLEAWQMNSIY